jgi:hypothetical protein
MKRQIRMSERLSTKQRVKLARLAFRCLMYGVLGAFFEIASFPLVRVGRTIPVVRYLFAFDSRVDERLGLDTVWHTPLRVLFGQTSLWMVPIYALTALAIETAYRKALFRRLWLVRAVAYGLIIELFEWATGFIVQAITGYKIWWYVDDGNLMHTTSVFILPVWMAVGLFVELIYRELMAADVQCHLEQALAGSEPRW